MKSSNSDNSPELNEIMSTLETGGISIPSEDVHTDMAGSVDRMVEISESLIHSIPENYFLSFSSEELNVIYNWAKSLRSAQDYFYSTDSAELEQFAYLMFDSKANVIHEHFLYKGTLLDRANFIKELEQMYAEENSQESPSTPNRLKILGMIQLERAQLDKVLSEYRKYMKKERNEDEDNLRKIIKRVIRDKGI